MKQLILLFAFSVSLLITQAQVNGDYRSTGAVTLTSAANWEVYNAGSSSWAAAAVSPNAAGLTNGNTITIQDPHTWSNSAACTIPAGVTLINQSSTLGAFSTTTKIELNGTYIHFTANTSTGNITSGMNTNVGSTFIYRASTTVKPTSIFGGRNYYNLVFDTDASITTPVANSSFTSPAPGSPWTVSGTLTVKGWSANFYHATNTNGQFNGDILVTGTGSVLTLKSTTVAAGKTLTIDAGNTLGVGGAAGGQASVLSIDGLLLNKSTNAIVFNNTGSMVVNNGGVYQHDVNGGTMPNLKTTYNVGSIISVTGITSIANIPVLPTACANVIWNCPAQQNSNTFINTTSNVTTVNGDFTLQSSGIAVIYLGGAGTARTFNVNGNINVNGGKLGIIKAPAGGAIVDQVCNVSGDVNIAGGEFYISDANGATSTAKGILNIGGSLNHTAGTFGVSATAVANSGVLTFTGNNTGKTISTVGIANGTIINIDKTTTGNIALASNLSVHAKAILNVTSGILNIAGKTVRLLSSAAGSAIVGPVLGSIDQTTAGSQFIVERYIPQRRAWRLITSPVSNANTINAAWQNGSVYAPGVGTFISGPGGTNGLDNGNAYSLKAFNNASQILENVTGTNVPLSNASGSADNKGYFLFVRGDRDPNNLSAPNTNATTLSATGTLQTSTQAFDASSTAGNISLIPNPYAAPVDFGLITRTNVAKKFWAWDPSLNTFGGYVTVDDMDDDGTYSYSTTSSQTHQLQQGQAVFVQTIANGTATVTFNESNKLAANTASGFRTNNGSNETLRLSLYIKTSDSSQLLADGCLAEFNNAYASSVDIYDGAKMNNINENISFERNTQLLSIERRPLVDGADTLFISLSNTTTKTYKLQFTPSNFANVVSAVLEDSYLNTSTPISLSSNTEVEFSITSDPASANRNRFKIVFRTGSVLPITFTSIKAYQKNAGIQVEWKVATESNVKHYEVERSANGTDFTKASELLPIYNNAGSYSWFDATPFNDNNFYRIKLIETTGIAKYSPVAVVKIANASGVVVYPNPVRNKIINIEFANQQKGSYAVKMYNNAGQLVFSKTITHEGGSATHSMQLNAAVVSGVYQVQVTNGDKKINQQVICE